MERKEDYTPEDLINLVNDFTEVAIETLKVPENHLAKVPINIKELFEGV